MPHHALNVSQPWDRVPHFVAIDRHNMQENATSWEAWMLSPPPHFGPQNLAPKKIRLDVFLLCSTFSGIMEKALDKWWPGCKLLSDSYFPLWDVFGWEETQDDSWKMVTSFAWCSHFLGTFLGDSGPGGVHPNWPCYLEHFGGVFQSNGSSKAHSAIATHGYIKFKWCWKMI